MKKINLILIVLVVFGFTASAEEWINFNERGESAPIYDLTNSTSSLVEFELEIPGMESKEINNFNRIYIPEHTKLDSIGFPEVPVITYLIAIPECDNVNLNVTVLDSIVIDNINIYPAPEWIEVNNGDYIYLEEQFTINNAFYNTNTYFPGYTGELVDKGLVRDQNCIRVTIYPVQFNPVQQQIIAYSRLNIEMTFENASGSVNNDVGIFNEVCGTAMINYNSNGLNASVSCGAGYTDTGETHFVETFGNSPDGKYIVQNCDYLIVTHHEFWDSPDLYNLAQQRANYNGFDVVIVKMIDIIEQVNTPNNWPYEKLKYLIRNTYYHGIAEHTYDGKLGYVNLFSDVTIDTGAQNPVPTYSDGYDVYFSQLTEIGGFADKYPDILLGRCSVGNIEEVTNVCTKILDYEPIDRNEQGYDEWNERMTFIAGEDFDSVISGLHLIEPFVEDYDTMLLTDTDYQYSFPNYDNWNYYSVPNLWNQYDNGNLIINYGGHGNSNNWSWDAGSFYYNNISTTNVIEGRLPLIFSSACYTGIFYVTDDCMAEEFIVKDAEIGAIGFIGASTTTGGCMEYFFPYCFEALSEGMAMCGEMILAAKLKTSDDSYNNHYNLIGDPALNILIDTENILRCDLICSEQEISIEDINNQSLQVTVGVTNSSSVEINDVVVECQITTNPTSINQSTYNTIEVIPRMETVETIFTFNISDYMPTEFDVNIIIDPADLIPERNEENNEVEKNYDHYRLQEGFPTVMLNSFQNINIPLAFDNSIIFDGKKISSVGEIIWDSGLVARNYSIPICGYDSFDYIIESNYQLFRRDGDDGGPVNMYVINGGDEFFTDWCLGDLSNNGEYELIANYGDDLESGITDIVVFDLDGNLLETDPIFYPKDIAIGDGNNDGRNEIYILKSSSIIKYEYVNDELILIDEMLFIPNTSKYFALADFNDDGNLDCVIFLQSKVIILNCNDLSPILEIPLTSTLSDFALGDIDNDGVKEIAVTQYGGGIADIYTIDILESGYQLLLHDIDICAPDSEITMCDLNSDNYLDFIVSDQESKKGYLFNGDLLFAYPDDFEKTHNIIFDVDSDGDLEIVFGEKTREFNQSGDTKLIASDLNIECSSIGNIYPRINEQGNNLFTQPVSGSLSDNTDYCWSGIITLHDEVTLPNTSTITIQPGTIIEAKENSKLTAYGDFIVNGTENQSVKFKPFIQSASQNYWQGLEFPEGNSVAELSYVIIENACVNAERELTISGGSFFNTSLSINSKNLDIQDSDFDNSPIIAELYGIQSLSEIISINDCNFTNLTEDSGIEVTGYPNINISNNFIENCLSGIKIWESGSGAINTISNNIITNNSQYGLFIYHSNIDILDHNVINNNGDGIFITRDSNFTLIGNVAHPLQVISDNNEYEVRFSYDSRPSQFYHNKIYDDNHEYSYVKCERIFEEPDPIDISDNNWGSTFNPVTDLSPTDMYIYLPIWYPGNPGDPEKGLAEELYVSAKQNEDSSNYPEAEQEYKQIISLYPDSEYAVISAKELLDLKVKFDQDFLDLKQYYETEPNMQFNVEMSNLAEFLITCCNVKLEEFQPAITWFEDIIQNPPSPVDSVFAVIDAGYTYLAMENSRSSFSGKISELKPKSRKQYENKRNELIDMLFGDPDPENEIPSTYKLAMFPNYPNPFNPETTISFSIPDDSKVGITVYNIKGQKVKTLINDELEKGLHDVVWSSKDNRGKTVASGIYFYKFEVNGKTKGLKKMLLLK